MGCSGPSLSPDTKTAEVCLEEEAGLRRVLREGGNKEQRKCGYGVSDVSGAFIRGGMTVRRSSSLVNDRQTDRPGWMVIFQSYSAVTLVVEAERALKRRGVARVSVRQGHHPPMFYSSLFATVLVPVVVGGSVGYPGLLEERLWTIAGYTPHLSMGEDWEPVKLIDLYTPRPTNNTIQALSACLLLSLLSDSFNLILDLCRCAQIPHVGTAQPLGTQKQGALRYIRTWSSCYSTVNRPGYNSTR